MFQSGLGRARVSCDRKAHIYPDTGPYCDSLNVLSKAIDLVVEKTIGLGSLIYHSGGGPDLAYYGN